MKEKTKAILATVILLGAITFGLWYMFKPTPAVEEEVFVTDDRIKEIYQTAMNQQQLPDDMEADLERYHKTKVLDLLNLAYQNNVCQAQLQATTTEITQ